MSKKPTGLRSFARRMSSSRLMPTGSWRTPLPSMIAIVLSELSRISSIKPRQRRRRRFGTNHTYSNQDRRLSKCMSATSLRDDIPARRTRTTGLHLRDVLLPQAELLVDTKYVLADGQGGHAVNVVRNTPKQLRALASGERLPHVSAPRSRACTIQAYQQR